MHKYSCTWLRAALLHMVRVTYAVTLASLSVPPVRARVPASASHARTHVALAGSIRHLDVALGQEEPVIHGLGDEGFPDFCSGRVADRLCVRCSFIVRVTGGGRVLENLVLVALEHCRRNLALAVGSLIGARILEKGSVVAACTSTLMGPSGIAPGSGVRSLPCTLSQNG